MIYIVKNNKPFGVLTQANNNITFEYDNSIQKKNYLPGLKEKINNSKVLFPLFGVTTVNGNYCTAGIKK